MLLKIKANTNLCKNLYRLKYRYRSFISIYNSNAMKTRAITRNKTQKPFYFSTNEKPGPEKSGNGKKPEETEKSEEPKIDMEKIIKEFGKINNMSDLFAFFYGKNSKIFKNYEAYKKAKSDDQSAENDENGEKQRDDTEPAEKAKKSEKSNGKERTQFIMFMYLALASISVLLFSPIFSRRNVDVNTVEFKDFTENYVAKRRVKKILIRKNSAIIYLNNFEDSDSEKDKAEPADTDRHLMTDDFEENKNGGVIKKESKRTMNSSGILRIMPVGNMDDFIIKMTALQDELGIPKNKHIDIFTDNVNTRKKNRFIADLLTLGFYGLLAFAIYTATSSGKSINNIFGGSFNNVGEKAENVKTKLSDVAGMKGAKVELKEFVDFLTNKTHYQKLGARIPKGALLVGPPGTGKTLLAKAIAGETNCPFYHVSGSNFLELFVGVGASRVRNLFEKARKTAPSIIFIDEIDAVAKKRHSSFMRSNSEGESTLNQLLIEMDGFTPSTGVIVLAGTNMVESLDKAILRPGRFDRMIQIDLPDIIEREDIFNVHLKPLKLAMPRQEIARKMAALTPQFSGADIANVCNEAAIFAGRESKKSVESVDFQMALDRIIAGLEANRKPLSDEERKHIAYHEAGHAVASWFSKHADPLLKVTIVPRTGGIMGFAQYLPNEIALMTADEISDKIAMALGGRVSELIFFGHLSSGAANDLEKVTQLAYGWVRVFGFSEEIGNISFPPQSDDSFLADLKPKFSPKLANTIDREVQKIVNGIFDKTKELLESKKTQIESLANELLKRETLSHDEIVQILGPKPWPSEQYERYLKVHSDI